MVYNSNTYIYSNIFNWIYDDNVHMYRLWYVKDNKMNKSKIKIKLNKVFEMASAAAGIVGIENLHDKKKVIRKYGDKKKELVSK